MVAALQGQPLVQGGQQVVVWEVVTVVQGHASGGLARVLAHEGQVRVGTVTSAQQAAWPGLL